MNMISPRREQNSRIGYVLVNIRASRPLFFTGLFDGCGRNMSYFLDNAYVFETKGEADQYIALNALVDDLGIENYSVRHTGFGSRARDYAQSILKNQHIKDIAGLAAVSLFLVSTCVWLIILSTQAESSTSQARHELVKSQQATVHKIGRDGRERTAFFKSNAGSSK